MKHFMISKSPRLNSILSSICYSANYSLGTLMIVCVVSSTALNSLLLLQNYYTKRGINHSLLIIMNHCLKVKHIT